MSIEIQLLGAERLRNKLELLGRPHPELVRAMEDVTDKLASTVKADKLSGQVLNVQTGRLRRSITRRVDVLGSEIDGIAGTNVEYAKIHEYGGTIHIPPRERLIRHRLTAKGELLKQKTNKNLLVFAKNSHKRAREMTVMGKGHDIHMPERSFMRSSLKDVEDYARQRILTALKVATQ